ncbi:NAD(P)-dependent alcohol dehydrogenase [Dyella humicola]|uniref:NAD(P)-dependent alcohol dehydrogenase n=1 Tax=Dyella humicola TaxID=2992126 RepID=UPI00224D82A1|nr:NAD(P)-dependent alcohol dehydrogenase [Dyella humicola]
MLAFRLIQPQEPPRLEEIPRPSPGPGQLLIKVGGCGLCHTDLGLMKRTREEWFDTPPPLTLGHEIAGWVAQIGQGVVGFKSGEPVAVVPVWGSCGHCAPCRRGEENFCYYISRLIGAGVGLDGGLAEYMLVEARFVVPMGDFDPVLAAPLTDAGLTTYTAIKPALPSLVPGSTAVVIGVGGLGMLAVQFLRTLCAARVIAVDTDAAHLELAKEHGADVALSSDASTAALIRDITSGAGASFVLDCVGAESTLTTGVAALARLGRLTLVGAALKTIPFGLHEVPWGAQLTTSLNGGTVNLREVIELARLGRIEAIVDRYPLDHVADAYRALADGKLRGRAVCIPGVTESIS